MATESTDKPLVAQALATDDRKVPYAILAGIAIVASALGIALGLLIDWFPLQASTQAEQIDTVWDVLIITSVPVFVLVTTVVLYSATHFKMRPGEELKDGPPLHGSTRLEVIWTAIPAIMMLALCTYAYVVLRDIEQAPAKGTEMNVRVVGEQFTWTFYYPSEGGKEIASGSLYLPVDTPVKFTVQSKDVLHDFWVPGFRMKIDAVPGIDTSIRVTTTRRGTYPVVCAELCGLGHAVMRQSAIVQSKAEFDKWLADKKAPRAPAAGGPATAAVDAKAIFSEQCGSCHTLADAGTTGQFGPNLDEVLAGKDEAFIRESIVDPDAEVEKGFKAGVMPPNFGDTLDDAELDALVKYLAETTK